MRYSIKMWFEYEVQTQAVASTGRRGWLRWLGWALVGATDAIGYSIGSAIGTPLVGGFVGVLGSSAAYFIFKGRGWNP